MEINFVELELLLLISLGTYFISVFDYAFLCPLTTIPNIFSLFVCISFYQVFTWKNLCVLLHCFLEWYKKFITLCLPLFNVLSKMMMISSYEILYCKNILCHVTIYLRRLTTSTKCIITLLSFLNEPSCSEFCSVNRNINSGGFREERGNLPTLKWGKNGIPHPQKIINLENFLSSPMGNFSIVPKCMTKKRVFKFKNF